MRTALSDHGVTLVAGAGMPESAVCPSCGCNVTLRRRRCMGGDYTYFWRHDDNSNRQCRERSRPYVHRC